MSKKIDYNEIIRRLGYFRNKANMSRRDASLKLGHGEQFMKRIENKDVQLRVTTLLEFLDLVEITPQEFFYLGTDFNRKDKELLEMINSLSNENKENVINIIKNLK